MLHYMLPICTGQAEAASQVDTTNSTKAISPLPEKFPWNTDKEPVETEQTRFESLSEPTKVIEPFEKYYGYVRADSALSADRALWDVPSCSCFVLHLFSPSFVFHFAGVAGALC